jgi:7,8-dihydropterin-6-yl-methyl-4-(beta-D-ribofuranosyl)aminobenzene 5'-phosphate synthase
MMISQLPLQMSVVYDNNPYDGRLKTDWGFSCFVEGQGKTILFDTGAKGQILLSNMEELGIQSERIGVVVLSHAHRDHTGGLDDLLSRNPRIEVWLPQFFAIDFKDQVRKKGAKVVEVTTPQKIGEGAYSSGVVESWIKEQSLVLDTAQGLLLITGCAHPGIVHIIARIRDIFKKDIFMALGGIHLAGFQKKEIREIIRKCRDSGIEKVGLGHCSGDEARKLFHEEYKEDFVELGVGKKIEIQ